MSFVCGSRSLGLITGLSWQLLESIFHILDSKKHYWKIELLFDELSVDSSLFLFENVSLFEEDLITKDKIYQTKCLINQLNSVLK